MQKLEYYTASNSATSIFINTGPHYYRELVKDKKIAVISSKNILNAYPDILSGENVILIDDVESKKNLAGIEYIIGKLLDLGIDRNSYIIGIGGGIVCDMAGFAAHIYMRGVRFGLVPTTLLAMADAAVGGKNGVNFHQNKNMVGSFDNPDFIVADSNFVQTTTHEQYMSGLGEIIKYALIGNDKIMASITKNKSKVLDRDRQTLANLIEEAINTKVDIVKKDPDDKGIRHILNFGHTIGHCMEITEDIPHGIAVVKGINAAVDISQKKGLLASNNAEQIKLLLSDFGYDISYHLGEKQIGILANDKKKEDSYIRMVLLEDIGRPIMEKLTANQIAELLG